MKSVRTKFDEVPYKVRATEADAPARRASRAWSWVTSVNERRDEQLERARERREAAARLRRLARGLSLNDDHERMMRQADALEAEAQRLEREAHDSGDPTGSRLAHGQPVRQEQVQQQQQHEVPDEPEAPSDKPPSKPPSKP